MPDHVIQLDQATTSRLLKQARQKKIHNYSTIIMIASLVILVLGGVAMTFFLLGKPLIPKSVKNDTFSLYSANGIKISVPSGWIANNASAEAQYTLSDAQSYAAFEETSTKTFSLVQKGQNGVLALSDDELSALDKTKTNELAVQNETVAYSFLLRDSGKSFCDKITNKQTSSYQLTNFKKSFYYTAICQNKDGKFNVAALVGISNKTIYVFSLHTSQKNWKSLEPALKKSILPSFSGI